MYHCIRILSSFVRTNALPHIFGFPDSGGCSGWEFWNPTSQVFDCKRLHSKWHRRRHRTMWDKKIWRSLGPPYCCQTSSDYCISNYFECATKLSSAEQKKTISMDHDLLLCSAPHTYHASSAWLCGLPGLRYAMPPFSASRPEWQAKRPCDHSEFRHVHICATSEFANSFWRGNSWSSQTTKTSSFQRTIENILKTTLVQEQVTAHHTDSHSTLAEKRVGQFEVRTLEGAKGTQTLAEFWQASSSHASTTNSVHLNNPRWLSSRLSKNTSKHTQKQQPHPASLSWIAWSGNEFPYLPLVLSHRLKLTAALPESSHHPAISHLPQLCLR